jgi:hypothetical protein
MCVHLSKSNERPSLRPPRLPVKSNNWATHGNEWWKFALEPRFPARQRSPAAAARAERLASVRGMVTIAVIMRIAIKGAKA